MADFSLLKEINEKGIRNRPRFIYEKGTGAKGTFKVYMSLKDYTSAKVFSRPDNETKVTVRFSKARRGAESLRDIRGFSVKFFTEDGEYDIICQNFPIFFINKPEKIPELMEAVMDSKETGMRDDEKLWGFVCKNPEALELMMMIYSHRGVLKSYRSMEGYSVNTYGWVNHECKMHYVRYFWEPEREQEFISNSEAEFLAGFSPDCASADLYKSIKGGDPPSFLLKVQIISDEERQKLKEDIMDVCKIWRVPYMTIGKMTLTDIPENHEKEIEGTSFSPSNIVPGIKILPDSMAEYMALAHMYGAAERRAK